MNFSCEKEINKNDVSSFTNQPIYIGLLSHSNYTCQGKNEHNEWVIAGQTAQEQEYNSSCVLNGHLEKLTVQKLNPLGCLNL